MVLLSGGGGGGVWWFTAIQQTQARRDFLEEPSARALQDQLRRPPAVLRAFRRVFGQALGLILILILTRDITPRDSSIISYLIRFFWIDCMVVYWGFLCFLFLIDSSFFIENFDWFDGWISFFLIDFHGSAFDEWTDCLLDLIGSVLIELLGQFMSILIDWSLSQSGWWIDGLVGWWDHYWLIGQVCSVGDFDRSEVLINPFLVDFYRFCIYWLIIFQFCSIGIDEYRSIGSDGLVDKFVGHRSIDWLNETLSAFLFSAKLCSFAFFAFAS